MAADDPEKACTLVDAALAIGTGIPFGETAPDGPLAAACGCARRRRLDAAELKTDLLLELGHHHEAILLLDGLTQPASVS